jgi:hypothetical protein
LSRLAGLLVLLAAAAALAFAPAVTVDGLGLFTGLLALGLAALSLLEAREPRKVVLQAGLVILALSTRHLAGIALGTQALALLVSRAAVLPAALTLLALVLLGATAGSLDLAAVGAASGPDAVAATSGAALLVLALLLTYVVVTRSALTDPRETLSSGAFACAGTLLAVGASLVRILAWLPDLADRLESGIAAAALLGLGYGGFQLWRAERLRSMLVGLALAQGGLVGLALLGGVHGRTAALLQLATSAPALVLLALGLARREAVAPLTLGELAASASPASSRALVALGTLASLALPPFPGFVARLASTSALLGRGRVAVVVVALALSVPLVLGGVRVVSAALEGPSSPRRGTRLAELLLVAAIIGLVLGLALFPGPLVEAAQRGAASLF